VWDENKSVTIAVLSNQSVPGRALTLSLMAMLMAVIAAVGFPDALLDQQILASMLALIPAFLLAHYRSWGSIALALGIGMVALCVTHLSAVYFGLPLGASPFILIVVTPYLAIALGAGWFGEVRRYKAELRATQLQLIQAEKLESMGRMAAGVAHEVKNPLMTILTGVKILSKRTAEADETTRLLLQDMADAVARADRIISGLLSYSRERGLDVVPADLNTTVARSLVLVKHDLDKAQIKVNTHLDPSLPKLTLDEFKIQQVLINLFTNALHAVGQGGSISLRTSLETVSRRRSGGSGLVNRVARSGRFVKVQIDDSGPGIPPDHLRKIFDPFFTTKPTGTGTGLGLSISRQIVEMHGGTIEIGNRDEGGARVTMMFKVPEGHWHDETANLVDRRRSHDHSGAGAVSAGERCLRRPSRKYRQPGGVGGP
jgi:signal transduction histidine kinase